ncbi:MAG: DUF4253 domain-containing protein [Pseudomonadota bacterium]
MVEANCAKIQIRRRELLVTALAGALFPLAATRQSMPAPLTPEETKRKLEEYQAKAAEARAKALAAFPFERIEVPGEIALTKWEELKAAGRGFPVIVGSDDALATLADPFSDHWPNKRSVVDILRDAERLQHPADLFALRVQERAKAAEFLKQHLEKQPNAPLPKMSEIDAQGRRRELTPEEARAAILQDLDRMPPTGDWPTEVAPAPGLSVVFDFKTRGPLQKAYIVLIPTDDWTTVPAHLHWGGWNACPSPEYHVAALRSWRDRYGVELVGLNNDTVNLTAARAPQARTEAMELAREQYAYCNDIVDQGVQTMSALAATLTISPWWYFWWD